MVSLRLCLLRLLPSYLSSQGAIALTLAIASSFIAPQAFTSSASARPVRDGSLNTQVDRQGNDFFIRQGVRRRRNLFHSFREFDIDANESVFFDGTGVENIFSRVTGGDGSDIFGTLGVVNSDANLFLMDPRGIVFGPNAQLDLRGSFVATTADQIEFGNRGSFRADSLEVPDGDLVIDPSAFVFNQVNRLPAIGDRRIINRADRPGLSVARGRSLLMLGGEVEFDGGYAQATNGRIQIGGLSEAGEVEFETFRDGREFRLSFLDDAARADITFGNSSVVDVTSSDRGDITITGANVSVLEGSSICAGIGSPQSCGNEDEDAPTFGNINSVAGNIFITATDTFALSGRSEVLNNVQENSTGNTRRNIQDAVSVFTTRSQNGQDTEGILFGSVFLTANNIIIQPATLVSTDTFGEGNAGLAFLSAGTINMRGLPPEPGGGIFPLISSSVRPGATGDAGGVFILGGTLDMTDFASISTSTFSNGNPGTVRIEADRVSLSNDSVIFSTVAQGGVAREIEGERSSDQGAIFIVSDVLELTSGSQLQTRISGPFENLPAGRGDAGNIVVNSLVVDINGRSPQSNLPSALFSSVGEGARGDGGFIFVNSEVMRISNFGEINAETFGRGRGGLIFLNSNLLEISNAGQVTAATFSSRRGGDILITTGSFFGNNFALVTTSTEAGGSAGDIVITAEQDFFLNGISQIRSTSEEGATGNGGEIAIVAGRSFWALNNSGATVSAFDSDNAAGNIGIAVGELFILDTLSFVTAATASGEGGNLTLGGNNFIVLLNRSEISTTAGRLQGAGNGGNIDLNISAAVIGSPFFDNNITAQAFEGDGGSIRVNGFINLFDIAERAQDFDTSNDITASSEFGADGFVGVNELDVDPVRGIIELPELIVDPDQLLVQACPGPGQATEEFGAFYVTGRGGIPPSPSELGRSDSVDVPWVSPSDDELDESDLDESSSDEMSRTASIIDAQIEAQDWIEDEHGEVWLVAHSQQRAIAPPPLPELCVSVPSAASQSGG